METEKARLVVNGTYTIHPDDLDIFANAVRPHIEETVFREDQSRTKTANAPENLATARKLALQMLNQLSDKESIKNRRKTAGWDDEYLKSILAKIHSI